MSAYDLPTRGKMRQCSGMERNTQLVGQSTSFLDAVERASRAAPLDRPVLVIGERGTGKELIAERLHHLSSRWDGPLIIMNCAALPETLIEAVVILETLSLNRHCEERSDEAIQSFFSAESWIASLRSQ